MKFYRGAGIKELNADEFVNNAIDGEDIPVIDVALPDGESVSDYRYQALSNIDQFITNRRTVQITGGLTDRVTAAIKFTKDAYPPGMVLILDPTNIPADTEMVQYDPEWFDAHPGVLAHVSTLYDGEAREDGDIVAFLDQREDKTVISESRRSEIEREGTASRVTSEREYVAFGSEIWLDDAVTNLVIYRGTTGTSPYTLARSLFEAPTYRSRLGDVYDIEESKIVASNDDYESQAKILYEEAEKLIQYDTNRLHIVAVDSMNDIRSDDGRIEPGNFRFVYNGRGFDTSYERNAHLLGN